MGVSAKSLLDVMINEGDISERDQKIVFRAAQEFYKESLIHVINKLPVNEPFWKSAVWPTTLTDRLHRGMTGP